jgi:hypothetical protein
MYFDRLAACIGQYGPGSVLRKSARRNTHANDVIAERSDSQRCCPRLQFNSIPQDMRTADRFEHGRRLPRRGSLCRQETHGENGDCEKQNEQSRARDWHRQLFPITILFPGSHHTNPNEHPPPAPTLTATELAKKPFHTPQYLKGMEASWTQSMDRLAKLRSQGLGSVLQERTKASIPA